MTLATSHGGANRQIAVHAWGEPVTLCAGGPSPGVLANMTGALLTDSWNSVQKLVEDLRPLMLKVACVGLAVTCKLLLIVRA